MLRPQPPAIHLIFHRNEDHITIDIVDAGAPIPTVQANDETVVDEDFLKELEDEVAGIVTPGHRPRNFDGGQPLRRENASQSSNPAFNRVQQLAFRPIKLI